MHINRAQSKTYQRLSEDTAAPVIPSTPAFSSDIEATVRILREMVKWRDPDLVETLRRLVVLCADEKGRFQRVITTPHRLEEPLLLELRHSQEDWVFAILHRNLANGWPIASRVERTDDALRFYDGDPRHYFGFNEFGKGCAYIGEYKDGLWHGQGKKVLRKNMHYTGEFVAGKKHGWGVEVKGMFSPERYEGIFIDDFYKGNPRAQPPAPVALWKTLFRFGS